MLLEIPILIIIVFFSIILHECAHGFAAYKLGDTTAKDAGRLTLNPLKHIDPVGTVILPGVLLMLRAMGQNVFLFGWAKPVPVNFSALKKPRRDMMIVGAAGPGTNILLAFILSRIAQFHMSLQIYDIIVAGVFINLLLAVFNLIPIPPLDGSRIVLGLLPRELAIPYSKLERYGIFIVIILLYFGMFRLIIVPAIVGLGALMGVSF